MSAISPVPEALDCHLCHGGQQRPVADGPCECRMGTGLTTRQDYRTAAPEMFDLAAHVRKTSEAQILALKGPP